MPSPRPRRPAPRRTRPGLALLAAGLLPLAGCRPSETPDQASTAAAEPSARPYNVVLVLADTLRASNLSSYGYSRETSPELAALAAESSLFEDVYAQAPCTYPSANSILTGRDGTHFWIQDGLRIGIPEGTPSLAEILAERGWTTIAVSASPIVRKTPSENNRFGGFDRGFDLFDEECLWADARCLNRKALAHLDGLREPFFLYLHYMDPHDPFEPPERRFSREDYPGKDFVAAGDVNPIYRSLYGDGDEVEVTPADLEQLVAAYDDEIRFFDQALGELVESLRARGMLERTVLAVVADHGEELLEHGHIKHCRTMYDTELATPMLLRLPERPGGERFPQLVQNLDLVPTVLEVLGIEAPGPLDGVSLLPVIESGEPVHDVVFAAYGSLRAAVSEEHKLIADFATGSRLLFDRRADPEELHDVAAAHPEVVARLEEALVRWVRQAEKMPSEAEALERGRQAAERLRALGYVE